MSRYQGLVALEGKDLEDAAHEYFLRSEQIPTRVRLAVGRGASAAPAAAAPSLAGRRPPAAVPAQVAGAGAQADLDPGDAPEGTVPHTLPEDDAWVEGRSLIATVEDVELIDPDAVDRAAALSAVPRARRARVPQPNCAPVLVLAPRRRAMLRSFSQDDRDHMVENGKITVTCEFCNSTYVFEPAEVADAKMGEWSSEGATRTAPAIWAGYVRASIDRPLRAAGCRARRRGCRCRTPRRWRSPCRRFRS